MVGENKLIGFPSSLLLQMCTNLLECGDTRLASDAQPAKGTNIPGEVKPSQYYVVVL